MLARLPVVDYVPPGTMAGGAREHLLVVICAIASGEDEENECPHDDEIRMVSALIPPPLPIHTRMHAMHAHMLCSRHPVALAINETARGDITLDSIFLLFVSTNRLPCTQQCAPPFFFRNRLYHPASLTVCVIPLP